MNWTAQKSKYLQTLQDIATDLSVSKVDILIALTEIEDDLTISHTIFGYNLHEVSEETVQFIRTALINFVDKWELKTHEEIYSIYEKLWFTQSINLKEAVSL